MKTYWELLNSQKILENHLRFIFKLFHESNYSYFMELCLYGTT
jgi:hypothetical protein